MLTIEQEKQVKELMLQFLNTDGDNLSQIQQRVNSALGLKLTYMEIRILASELEGVDWGGAKKEEPKAEEKKEEAAAPESEEEAVPAEEEAAAPATGKAVVEVSRLAVPGALYSGTVTFPNGSTAEWYLDQMGRLGIDKLVGDKPGPEDVKAFQVELQNQLEKIAR